MNASVQGPVSRENFRQWLETGSAPLTVERDANRTATLLKLSKTPEIDYVYGTVSYRAGRISWSDDLTCCGVYDRCGKTLYLADSPLTDIVDGITAEERQDTSNYSKTISGKVNEYVERTLANDRSNLSVTEITDWQALQSLEHYREHGAREEAVGQLFYGQEPDGQFHSRYALDGMPEAAFIAWLQDPDEFVRTEAEQYMKSHQEEFLLDFLENDLLLAAYQALLQDTGDPVHRMKTITDAVKSSGARTVTVTIQKDGQELTFKTAAYSLTGHWNYYSAYDIQASDRRRFEKLFGRYADYTAEDITKITYGRNTIYEAPPVQTEELVQGMEMGGM